AFSFHPPGYFFMQKYKDGVWDGLIRKLKYDKVPTGLFRALRNSIEEELDIRFLPQPTLTKVNFQSIISPDTRDYQADCVAAMQTAAQLGGGLVVAATGVGKTRIAGEFFKSLVGSGCFIVDELTLLHQSKDAIEAVLGEPVGIVGESKF